MKILHTVEFYEPSKGGSEEVIRQISERLALRGHQVTVATSYLPDRRFHELNGVRVEQFRIRGNYVKGLKGEIELYKQFLRSSKFDVMLNYGAQSWPTDLAFQIIEDIPSKKFIMPMGYSRLKHPKYQDYFQKLPKYLCKYDKIIYSSPNYQDKFFGDNQGLSDRAVIIRNGASQEEFERPILGFRKKYGITSKFMFISVANHYFSKGHSFVIEAFKMLKTKNCSLVIIGERPQAHPWYSCYPFCRLQGMFNDRIHVLNNVPRDLVVSAYHEADAFVFGSKIECAPLVTYESFASRTPFITTDVGIVKDHKELIRIVRNPIEMASELHNLMENPVFYKTMTDRAYDEFNRLYSWEKIAEQFEILYSSTLYG